MQRLLGDAEQTQHEIVREHGRHILMRKCHYHRFLGELPLQSSKRSRQSNQPQVGRMQSMGQVAQAFRDGLDTIERLRRSPFRFRRRILIAPAQHPEIEREDRHLLADVVVQQQ